jgi:hypothetical protein
MSEEIKSDSERKKEDWMNSKWRPMMGWLYMTVCAFDFILFPVMWSMLQAVMKVGQITQWNPLTLQGAGLFHIAMGAVLGIAAFGRTQEKLNGANNGGAAPTSGFSVPQTSPSFGGGFAAPAVVQAAPAPAPAPGTSFAPAATWGATTIATTASGKKLVPDEPQPAI